LYRRRAIDILRAALSGSDPYRYAKTQCRVMEFLMPGWYEKIRSLTCPICGRRFSSTRALGAHLRIGRCSVIAREICHLVDRAIEECVNEVSRRRSYYEYDGVRYTTIGKAVAACAIKRLSSSGASRVSR